MSGTFIVHTSWKGVPLEFTLEAQRKLVPEMIELLQERYRLLKFVKMAGPIGRRPLGEMSEFDGTRNSNDVRSS